VNLWIAELVLKRGESVARDLEARPLPTRLLSFRPFVLLLDGARNVKGMYFFQSHFMLLLPLVSRVEAHPPLYFFFVVCFFLCWILKMYF
jgi:hypothetical protein